MDVLCFDDLDAFGRDLNDPIAELEQDIVHMLFESYGTNVHDRERSIGLEDALSGPSNASITHRIEEKLVADARIDAARATLTPTDSQTVRIDLQIQANGEELGIALQYDAAGNIVRITT